MCAQPKVVVKIESEEDMLVLQVSMSNFFCVASVNFIKSILWDHLFFAISRKNSRQYHLTC